MTGPATRFVFQKALTNPKLFRSVLRPALYKKAGNDPERVHEMAIEMLNENESLVEKISSRFDFPDLHVELFGQEIMPFGTAAGFDKNGEALLPLSHVFGFQEPGTVVVDPREGNPRPRLYADTKSLNVYNAQGFPSKGLENFLKNIKSYRKSEPRKPVIVSVCGLPDESGGARKLDAAYSQLGELLDKVGPYADGFVWNPFSPNTAALQALRTPDEFRKSAQLISDKAGKKLKLVKMGPYENSKQESWLGLARSWMGGGGDGIVAVNTYMTPKDELPLADWAFNWGYKSAGISGHWLQSYRQKAIKDFRKLYSDAKIIATGGIDSAEQALSAFEAGADLLEGYTPYIFNGLGLLIEISKQIQKKLRSSNYSGLQEYIHTMRAAR